MQMILDQKSMLDTQLLNEQCSSSINAIRGVFRELNSDTFLNLFIFCPPSKLEMLWRLDEAFDDQAMSFVMTF